MNKKFTKLIAAIALLAFMMPSMAGWGQTRTAHQTTDFSWPNPIKAENFNSLTATSGSGNGSNTTTITNLSGYGIFNKIYVGKNANNTYAIVNDNTFGSNVYRLSSASTQYIIASVTNPTISFGDCGAFSVKISKNDHGYFGIYAADDATLNTKANSSVYFQANNGALSIQSGDSWQTIGSYTTNTIEVCVLYNNSSESTIYGGTITLASKKCHVYVNGTCVMDGESPKNFTIPGATLGYFRFCTYPEKDVTKTMTLDDVNIYNSLPTAASTNPSITISEEDLQLPYTENENGSFTVNYSNFEPAAATAVLYSDQACTQAFPTSGVDAWIWLYDDDLVDPFTSIPYMVTTNESITERTVYLKVVAMDADLNDIDEVFTITQAGLPTYTVTYNANGATGNVPTDATQYTPLSNTVTVLGNIGSPALAKTGYSWSGWCLDAGSTGTVYGPEEGQTHTFTISKDTTLYAKWTINSYSVTLPAEDVYGTYTMNKTNPVAYGTEVTLTYTPKTGYENYEATWSVNGTVISGNKFTMPDEAVTVTVGLTEVLQSKYIFNTDAGLNALGITKPSSGQGTDLEANHDYTIGNVTMTCTHGGTNTRVWNKSGATELRVYKNGTLTFAMNESGYYITKVTFTGTVNLKVGTTDVTNKTWSCKAQSVTFTNKDSNSALGTITVEYSRYYTLHVNKHGANGQGGWYLISSPLAGTTAVSDVTNLINTNLQHFDLYRYNQTATKEWENYKAKDEYDQPLHADFTGLVSGHGYLYANDSDDDGVDLVFTGAPYNGDGVISLSYDSEAELPGWNLIGNPFGTDAALNLPYYQMNAARTALGAKVEGGEIAVMEGVFVYAYDQTASQTIATATFTPVGRSANTPQGIINLNVENNGSVIDNAIVRFDEGYTLPKFYFGNPNANLYIPQGEKEFAILSAEAQGEMPLNFRANADGQYTLTVNPEGIEMNYLHLIDNMTGNDIDLLQTPSYSFNAKTTDYESRFRLVFAANNESGVSASSTTFAFYSNGNWMVNNEGEATLQIIDVMGRVLSNQTISGTAELNLNQQPGVYVLRLVNGNDVKTQKIVVK